MSIECDDTSVDNTGDAYVDSAYHAIFDRRDRTNSSREIRIEGWLGTDNNVHREAKGQFETLDDARDYCIEHASEREEPACESRDIDPAPGEIERYYWTDCTSVGSYCDLGAELIQEQEGLVNMDEDELWKLAEEIVRQVDETVENCLMTDSVGDVAMELTELQEEQVDAGRQEKLQEIIAVKSLGTTTPFSLAIATPLGIGFEADGGWC